MRANSGSGSVRELTALLSALRRARHPDPAHAAQLHARLLVSGCARHRHHPHPHPVLLTQLVSLYAAAGRPADALRAFRAHLPSADLRSHAALVSALARPRPHLALSLFSAACRRGLRPSPHLVSAVLPACAALPSTLCGRQVHACAAKAVPPRDVFVYTGLVDVYAKAGDVEASRKVFDEMPRRAAASWNALLVGYARNKMCLEALSVFRELVGQGREVPLDQVSVSGVLSACSWAGIVDFGRQVHACAAKLGLEPGAVCVSNALLDMYTRCRCSREAFVLFDAMDCRDVVTWNVVICACINESRFKEACMLFQFMVRDGVLPDDVSFATALQASACMLSWALGASIHASVIKAGFLGTNGIASSLITMYSKCSSLDDALRAFQEAEDHLCVLSWTAMITALQQNGHGEQAVGMFEKMLDNGIPPDPITFVSVLSSCSHTGLVEQGRRYFNSMTQVHKITPWTEHYACMVDMFGRAGLLSEAKQFIDEMRVKPDASVLGALLSACLNYRNLEIGEEVAKKLFVIEPGNTGNYVLLANIYASHGRLEEAKEVRKWMMFHELNKGKGCSVVNNENQTSTL